MAMAMAAPALPSSSLSRFSPSSLPDEGSSSRAQHQRLLRRIGRCRTPRSCSRVIRNVVTHKDEGDLRTSFDADALDVPVHTVTVHDRKSGAVHTVQVPEDQYILHTAEYQDVDLPFSCRHGCCTACAVRVKSGEIYQPRALGISTELKEQGYALLCVGYPLSDLEVETQDEDEVYWLQFGQYFARGPLERDDYALELAVADE